MRTVTRRRKLILPGFFLAEENLAGDDRSIFKSSGIDLAEVDLAEVDLAEVDPAAADPTEVELTEVDLA